VGRALDDAVVYVGHVHDLQYPIALRMQKSAQNVLKYESAKVPNVCERIDRGTAGVNAHLALVEWFERFDAVRQRVVEHYRLHFVPCTKRLFYLRPSLAANPKQDNLV
jgi:hypothetical protein